MFQVMACVRVCVSGKGTGVRAVAWWDGVLLEMLRLLAFPRWIHQLLRNAIKN